MAEKPFFGKKGGLGEGKRIKGGGGGGRGGGALFSLAVTG